MTLDVIRYGCLFQGYAKKKLEKIAGISPYSRCMFVLYNIPHPKALFYLVRPGYSA